MSTDVIARVRARDFTVLRELAGLADGQAVADLLADDDAEVRELALLCLEEVGGAAAERAATAALFDSNEQVQGAAVRVLRRHATADVRSALLASYSQHPSPVVRRQIALVLGKMLGPAGNLVALLPDESSPEARNGLLLAAGQRGDAHARAELFVQINAASAPQRKELLDDIAFLQARWALPGLAPLLADTTPVLRIGADGIPGPQHLRVCDLVVKLAATLGASTFSFPIDQRTNYAREALAEVERYLRGLAPVKTDG